MSDILITINTQDDGVSRKVIQEGDTLQDVLESVGVDTESSSVMVNGEEPDYDATLNENDRVVVTKDGKNN